MTDKVIKTYWWRHGQTDWNAARKWQGHSDIPLNDVGLAQAEKLAGFFDDLSLECILTSDLKRARKTAETVAERQNVEVAICEQIREGHYGRAEGLTMEEIRRKFGVALLEKWRSPDESTWDIDFVGGETKREIVTRVLSGVNTFLSSTPFKQVGISTHGGVIRKVLNFVDREIKLPSPIPNCVVIEMDYVPNQEKWQFVGMHETQ